jgi:hypothetical protein
VSPFGTKITIGILVIALGGGAVIVIGHQGRSSNATAPGAPGVSLAVPPELVHTAAWYVAHPDIAKQDEDRCGGDAASISPAACQNVASAEQQLLANEMKNAAAANEAASANNNSKTP